MCMYVCMYVCGVQDLKCMYVCMYVFRGQYIQPVRPVAGGAGGVGSHQQAHFPQVICN